jgi:hypothetical protein
MLILRVLSLGPPLHGLGSGDRIIQIFEDVRVGVVFNVIQTVGARR